MVLPLLFSSSWGVVIHGERLGTTISDRPTDRPTDRIAFPVLPAELRTAGTADALISRFAESLETAAPAAAVLVEPLLNVAGCIVLPRVFFGRASAIV
jgi:hypothetical protein